MKRDGFATDVSRSDFEKVRHLLDGARKTTRPKIHDTYDVFCAVLYHVRNEAPWRSLPDSFPQWRSVHHHFIKWTSPDEHETTLEQALHMVGLPDVAASVRTMIDGRRKTTSPLQ